MATIFERIETGLKGNDLAAQLNEQIGKIGTAGSLLDSLAHGKMPELDALKNGLLDVAAPNINVTGNFAASLTSLQGAIPSDLSGLTGGITTALSGLGANVSTNIVGQIQKIRTAITALQQLTKLNFTSLGTSQTAPPPAGAAPAAPPAPAPAPAPVPAGAPAPPPPAPAPDAAAEARERRLAAINTVNQALDTIAPFTPPTFITFLHDRIRQIPRDIAQIRKLPFIDDLFDLFTTVVDLRAMDAAALQTYIHDTTETLAAFLTANAGKPVADFVAQLSALAAKVDASTLKSETDALTTALARIGAAVSLGDLTPVAADIDAANTTLNTLLPRVAALNANLFDGQVDAAQRALERLPIDTERLMRRLVQAAKPVDQAQMLQSIGDRLAKEIQFASPDQLAADVDDLLQPLVKGLDAVSVLPIREPLLTAVDAVKTAADDVDRLLAQAAGQAALLFNQVDTLLAQIDTTSVTKAIQDAIAEFQNTLKEQADKLFQPVKDVIATAVSNIDVAASGFNADAIVNALQGAIGNLADVLNGGEVKTAIDAIHQAFDSATQALQSVSFAPLTGQVIAEIDQITGMLKAIDPSQLSLTTKLALQAAVEILPGDLKPITGPLVTEFDHLVDTGPKPLLQAVEAKPAQLMDQIKGYSPAKLIGGQFSKPFQDLIARLEQFKPSSLLAPVEQALNGIKDQVRQTADPGKLLQPLEALFNQLMAQFDKLKPDELIQGLNDQVQGIINKALAALQVDTVLHAFDDVLAVFKGVRDSAAAVKTTLEKVSGLFEGLADPDSQLQAWVQPIYDRLDQLPNVASLQPSFDKVTAAVNASKAAALRSALQGPLAPLETGLQALRPQEALGALSAAYGSIRPDQVAALPAAQRSAVQALVGRFNPVSADFARPFEGLKAWLDEMKRDETPFGALMDHWDARYHGANGPLAGFIHPAINSDELKTTFRDALENEVVQPLAHLLGIVHNLAAAAKPPLEKVAALIDDFDQKMDDLLLGPGALGGLRDAVNGLIDRLRYINFDFLTTQLNTTFQTVKDKLQAVSPTAVRKVVDKVFDDALNLLDVSRLLPKTELDTLDGDYQKIIDNLKKFDPKKLIVDVAQPVFDQTILPLVKAFDIAALLQTAIARLEALKTELQAELDKTDQAYQQMLQAVPSISLTDLADIGGAVSGALSDIGGSLGF